MKSLRGVYYLCKRNAKVYFKNPMTFFVSLITPLILLSLFLAFLKTTYENSLISAIGEFEVSGRVVDGFTGGWLFSSVLSTSCTTVAFCSGTMVEDKINSADLDLSVTPVKPIVVKLSYTLSNLICTLLVVFALLSIGLVYLAIVGFYLSFADVLLAIVNIVLTSSVAVLLANIVWLFTKSQGVVSGICTALSALYGFVCGAYMPINGMGEGMKIFASLLPGTYSTILFRQYFLSGPLEEISKTVPQAAVDAIGQSFDVEIGFFGHNVPTYAMYLIVAISCLVLLAVLSILTYLKSKKRR